LHKIAIRSKRVQADAPQNDLVSNCFDHLSLFAEYVVNIGVADAYLKLLEAVANCDAKGENDPMAKQIWAMADIFLKVSILFSPSKLSILQLYSFFLERMA
jgi:hypothetical protein